MGDAKDTKHDKDIMDIDVSKIPGISKVITTPGR